MVFLNRPVKDYDKMKNLGNGEFWIIEKNEKGKYKVKDDIFNEEKETKENRDDLRLNKNFKILESIENIVEDKENFENIENLESLDNIIEDKENK